MRPLPSSRKACAGARGQWTALRARHSDHREATGPTAVLNQIEKVGHVLVAVVWSQYSVPESAEFAPSVDRTPSIRRDLVYLAEWMCKFNVRWCCDSYRAG